MQSSLTKKLLMVALLSILAGSLLTGCQKQGARRAGRSASIEIEKIQADPKPAGGSSKDSSLPYFQVSSGEPTDEINRLDEIIDEVRESYENALQDDNEKYTIISEKTEGSRYLLTTMYITDDWISLTGRQRQERNIVTLAYDKNKDVALTGTEALQSTGITGVQLSQRTQEQLLKLQKTDPQYAGNLRSTEMQGFALDENGKVTDIYMKLEVDTGKDELETFFFHFDPASSTMTALQWPE